jgi:acetyl-CoA C-acetyltransferase
MDEFALRSHTRAVAAAADGFFDREIVPIRTPAGVVSRDDCPRPTTTLDQLAALRPVFHPEGAVTAGNSCPLNDGAAAVVVVQRAFAEERGLVPLARIVGAASAGIEPELMGMGPVPATRKLLDRLGLAVHDIDLVEINEAFAAQVIPAARELGIDERRLNVRGGAIALGHPFGMTGARMVTTLVNGLRTDDLTLGLATLCVGGGQGMAMLLEREA